MTGTTTSPMGLAKVLIILTTKGAKQVVAGCIPMRAVTTSPPVPTLKRGTVWRYQEVVETIAPTFSPMGLVTVQVLTRRLVAEQDVVGVRLTARLTTSCPMRNWGLRT